MEPRTPNPVEKMFGAQQPLRFAVCVYLTVATGTTKLQSSWTLAGDRRFPDASDEICDDAVDDVGRKSNVLQQAYCLHMSCRTSSHVN